MKCGGKMKLKSGGNWIQSAIKKPGSFTAQANSAGMSVPAFRDKVLSNKGSFSPTTVKRANLAKTLSKMRKGQDGLEMDMGEAAAPEMPLLDSNTMRRKEMLMEREAQLQEKKVSGVPESQMAPLSMQRGGRLYAQLGMLNGKPIQGPKPAPVKATPAAPAMDPMEDTPRVQAIDPKLTETKAMLKSMESEKDMGRNIKPGGTQKVADYQSMLNKKYNAGLTVDGAWGKNTQAAYAKYVGGAANTSTAAPKGTMGPTRADMPGNFQPFKTSALRMNGPTRDDKMNYKSAPAQSSTKPLWQTATERQSFIPGKAGDMVVNPSYPFLNKQPAKTVPAKATATPKAPIATPGKAEAKKATATDNRQLPFTGVVVDRGTNETFVFGEKNNFQMPVLTGQNRNMYADANMGTVQELEKDKKGRVTPRGYYVMDQNNVTASDKKEYNGNIRHLEPIEAFGMNAPKAKNVGMHQTYNPGRRDQFYNQSGDMRGQSYGCINGRCGDIQKLMSNVSDRDTVLVIDSRLPQDQGLFKQAQQKSKVKKRK